MIDAKAVLTPQFIQLGRALSANKLSSFSQWLSLFLPSGIEQQSDWRYELSANPLPEQLNSTQQKIIYLLKQKGPLRKQQLEKMLPYRDWQTNLQQLIRQRLVKAQPILKPPSVKPSYRRLASLAIPAQEIDQFIAQHATQHTASWERRKKALLFLAKEGKAVQISWVYAASGANAADIKKLAQIGAIHLHQELIWRDPLAGKEIEAEGFFNLTEEQTQCWHEIRAALHRAWNGESVKPILLFGITGSGKTELYLRAVAETIENGRQAIVLVPEISLTIQTIQRFQARFGEKVGLQHSRLSAGEQFDTWRRVRAGLISVVIGPRSALFVPFSNPGLVIMDECHDDSFYHDAQPNYHTADLAQKYMEIAGGMCLLGSATPSVEQFYLAQKGEWQFLRLSKRIISKPQNPLVNSQNNGIPIHSTELGEENKEGELPKVYIVDMRAELRNGNRSIFSQKLQSQLAQALALNQQAILFLNRRGMATYVFCRDCGAAVKCPHCDISLTYHQFETKGGTNESLICHRCGYRRQMPKRCPQCGSTQIRQFGIGTEKVETEVKKLFPQARVTRWDFDTTRHKGAHEIILNQFANHQADILIGTQMLAKGLDLPSVTLVGIILAEVGLNLPDYRAAERTFQHITQVAGRAGRGQLKGEVILQTYLPDHYAIVTAASQDYEAFYKQELEKRRIIQYPPFSRILRLEYRGIAQKKVEMEAQRMAGDVRSWMERELIHSIRM
ncbi:MAG: replication restart helicase PriA, partial [Anaerolineales bacterium]